APRVTRADGGRVPAVRPAVPDGHGTGQVGGAAGATSAVRPAPRGVEEAPVAGPGEGAGVPGRAADGGDVERGGAREPAVPQDAEGGVPGADTTGDRGPSGSGPPARASGRGQAVGDPGPPA